MNTKQNKIMNYLSVCSGIESASVAWRSLGWNPVAFSEIEKFPSEVLAYHFPDVPNLGDVTKHETWQINESINILVGGFPCQDLSIAGKRKGLVCDTTQETTRSGIFFEISRLADRLNNRWTLLENVPGLLSSKGGADFAAVVSELCGNTIEIPRGGWKNSGMCLGAKGLVEWAILDAQNFGVPQRRRRVFIIRDTGDWRGRQPIFIEQIRGTGNTNKIGTQGKAITSALEKCTTENHAGELGCSSLIEVSVIPIAEKATRYGGSSGIGFGGGFGVGKAGDPSPCLVTTAPPYVHVSIHRKRGFGDFVEDNISSTLTAHSAAEAQDLVAFTFNDARRDCSVNIAPTLRSGNGGGACIPAYAGVDTVRKLTPNECARLQGFPDNWAKIPWRGKPVDECPEGHQYKAYGNSMATPVMKWIGEQIQKAENNEY